MANTPLHMPRTVPTRTGAEEHILAWAASKIAALAHYEGDATITIEGNRAWGMGAS